MIRVFKAAPRVSRVSVGKDTGQQLVTATSTVVLFETDIYDPDGLHSTVSNVSRITIPAGAKRAQFFAGIAFVNNAVGVRRAALLKNGSGLSPGMLDIRTNPDAAELTVIHLISPILTVAAADYFEMQAYQTSGGNLFLSTNNCHFGATVYYS